MSDEGTIKLHKMISGKLYDIELRKQRFEQTMDRIDHAVTHGATAKDLLKKFGQHIVHIGKKGIEPYSKPAGSKTTAETAVSSSEPKGDKAAIVQAVVNEYPHFTVGQVAKKVSAQGHMTYANAHYLAKKIVKS